MELHAFVESVGFVMCTFGKEPLEKPVVLTQFEDSYVFVELKTAGVNSEMDVKFRNKLVEQRASAVTVSSPVGLEELLEERFKEIKDLEEGYEVFLLTRLMGSLLSKLTLTQTNALKDRVKTITRNVTSEWCNHPVVGPDVVAIPPGREIPFELRKVTWDDVVVIDGVLTMKSLPGVPEVIWPDVATALIKKTRPVK